MKPMLTVLALLNLLPCLPVLAQNWIQTTMTDPMSDKAYTTFALEGKGVDEDLSGTIALFCADRKFQRAGFTVRGMTFHYDSYAALRNPPYVTYAKVRTGTKVESKAFLASQDMKSAQISHDELEKMMNAGSATIQFADGLGSWHYLRFDGMSPLSKMADECGARAERLKQK